MRPSEAFREVTTCQLDVMPTLAVGQAADLKIDTGTMRVWRSRCRPSDGETQPVQVERLEGGRWVDVTDGDRRWICLDGDWEGVHVEVFTRKLAEDWPLKVRRF